MVWKPGESGNPKGKKPGTLKEKPYRDALRMEIAAAEDFKSFRGQVCETQSSLPCFPSTVMP
jgi:hypothetical protein